MSLSRAIVVGLVLGAIALGTASYVTADSSNLLFGPGEQAVFGGVAGGIGGALAGVLVWAVAVAAEGSHRFLRRKRERRP